MLTIRSFVNCIYLSDKIPPFIDVKSLSGSNRKLSVVCDVSCDTTNPHSTMSSLLTPYAIADNTSIDPIPIYDINTTFSHPTVPVDVPNEPPLSVISIDHLPSLLPREASEAFSGALLPYLKELKDWEEKPVWQGAEKLFKQKCDSLSEAAEKDHIKGL
jgi:saccharopine dehydrogenase (NAD+, L-lysine-forming)